MLSQKDFLDLANNNITFVAGSGRSGTTWLQELINYQRDYRIIFEPFWCNKVPFVDHFQQRQYLRVTNNEPCFQKPALRILQGDFRNEWTDRFNEPITYRKRLIKDIRANLLLKWLKVQVMPQLKIVFIMRHPCAVAVSRLKLGWENQKILAGLEQQTELTEDFLKPFAHLKNDLQDNFEYGIFQWAIENYVPLGQFSPNEIHLLFYEEMLDNPERELSRLFAFLELPLKPALFDKFDRPSAMSRKDSAIKLGKNSINAWNQDISSKQAKRAIQILSYFGLDEIYGEEAMPYSAAANRLLEKTF